MSETQIDTVSLSQKFSDLLITCNTAELSTIKTEIDAILNVSDSKIASLFIRTLINVIPARYTSLDNLAKIVNSLQASGNEEFKANLLKEIEKRTKESNNEIVCTFLASLMRVEYITADYLMDLVLRDMEFAHKLGNDVFIQLMILVVSCCTDLKQANPQKLEQIFEAFDSRKHVVSSGLFQDENAPIFEDFHGYVEEIKNNGWVIPNNFPLKEILDAIKEDSPEKLREQLVGEYNIDYQINPSVLLAPPILGFSAPLVSVCAFFCAKKCLEMLINSGCDLSIEDDEGRDVMQFAVASGNMDIIRMLFAKGIPISGCFSIAIEFMHKDAFDFLKSKQPNLSYGLEEAIDCPLHSAAKINSVYFTNLLLNENVSCLSRDDYNWTPLHIAASYNSIEALTILLKHCTDPNVADLDGDTPLHCAAKEGFIECLEILLKTNGVKADAHDRHGATPLHYAACYDRAETVEHLLRIVGPNLVDEFHRSALQLAALSGCSKSAETLAKDQRIDPNIADMDKVTPLLAAVTYGELDVVKAVCEAKSIDLNKRNKDNLAPIELAAFNNKEEIVRFLSEAGADKEGLMQAKDQLSPEMQTVVTNL